MATWKEPKMESLPKFAFNDAQFVAGMQAIQTSMYNWFFSINEMRDCFGVMTSYLSVVRRERMNAAKQKPTYLNRQSRHRGRRSK